jgi:N6-L-threonylcarbamoyladenine synthase
MKILGIESTAHTFSAAIIENKKILSQEKSTIKLKQGLIPRELFNHHIKVAPTIIKKTIKKAGINLKELNAIAFSQGPGIGNALKVGAISARTLALKLRKPCIPVNHCIAHIVIGEMTTKVKDPVIVFVSGANTQIIIKEKNNYKILGETLDIGLGNLLDCFGRTINIGFPAGPKLDKAYFKGKKLVELPYTVKGMDLTFSGLLTAAQEKLKKEKKNDVIYSLLETAFSMLTEVTERALAHTNKNEVLLVGGVASSNALRKKMKEMCNARKAKLFIPKKEYCGDNAAMIALTALLKMKKYKKESTEIKPYQRIDEVKQ